eukprot:3515126-Karenia_brevis.AAC.1
MRVWRPAGGELSVCWAFLCTGEGFCAHPRGLLVNLMHRRRVWGIPNGRSSRGGGFLTHGLVPQPDARLTLNT